MKVYINFVLFCFHYLVLYKSYTIFNVVTVSSYLFHGAEWFPGFICVVVSSLHTTVRSLHDDSMVCEYILWSLDTRIAHRFEVYCFGFVFMNDGTVRMCSGEEGQITQGIRPRDTVIESQNPQPASGPPWSRPC